MTDISIKEYLQSQVSWLDKYFQSQIHSIHDAVNKANDSLSTRLDGMNEFRLSLKDQAGQFATKNEVKMQFESIDQRLKSLEISKANLDGKTSIISAIVAIVVSLLTALAVNYFR